MPFCRNPLRRLACSGAAPQRRRAAVPPRRSRRYDASGSENGDLCAWNFGTTQKTGTATWNVQLGSYKFLLQQEWANTGACVLEM